MPAIVLYSKPQCVQCDRTKLLFEKRGLEFTEVDITKDPDAYNYVTKTLGYSAAPVVVTENDHWYGLRPDKIGEITQTL